MTVLRSLRRWARVVVAFAARPAVRRLAPGQPPLTADEWAGCAYSFSQLGEDRMLVALLGRPAAGEVYVDVGAHDPVRYSNTLLLYKLGWRGVNVDASGDAVARLAAARPGDRNVWAAVSDRRREVVYYRYPSRATNRIGPAGGPAPLSLIGEEAVSADPMVTVPLNDLLADALRPGERVGLLNIDCEGEDLILLRHLDWPRFRPRVVAVESHDGGMTEEMTREMAARGYTLVGKALVTLVFRRDDPPVGDSGGSDRVG